MAGSATSLSTTRIHVAPGLDVTDRQRELVGAVLDLFSGRCSHWRLTEFFTEDAQYLDGFAAAEGRDQIGGQMFGLPIVCQSSVTLAHLVVAASARHIELRMIHLFHFAKAFLLGKEVKFSTRLTIETDGHGKITKFTDRPEEQLPDSSIIKAMRDANSVIAPILLQIPKSPEADDKWWAKHVADRPEQDEREAEHGGPGGEVADEPSKRG